MTKILRYVTRGLVYFLLNKYEPAIDEERAGQQMKQTEIQSVFLLYYIKYKYSLGESPIPAFQQLIRLSLI